MDLGLYVDAHPRVGRIARAAEEAGFRRLWIYDSPLVFGDVYIACADALEATERIEVGPGVTYPDARPAHATAQALATLSKIAPGRVVFGLGRGNSARHSFGARPATLDELFAYADAVRGLLAGETVDYRGNPIRFIHPQGRWIDIAAQVPLWLSVFGPKGQSRAAPLAPYGVLVRWTGPDAIREVRARIGDDPAIGVVFAVYPIESDGDLDTPEARAALGPLVVSRLRYLTANHASVDEVPPEFRKGYAAYSDYRAGLDEHTRHLENFLGYLVFTPDHLERFVTPESMRKVAFIGRAEEVRGELDRMREADVDHASLQMSGDPVPWLERMATVYSERATVNG